MLVTLVNATPYKVGWVDGAGKGGAQGEWLSAVGRPGPLAAAIAEAPILGGGGGGVGRGDDYPGNGWFTRIWLGL